MGIGSTGDHTIGNDPRSATIVRFKPDGSSFEVFAKGLRNPYGIGFDKDGNLFATDNGPDSPPGPDELDQIVQGGDYGFPNVFGTPPPGSGTIPPVVNLQTHSSSDGFTFYYGSQFPADYQGNAFIAQWGANNADPNIGKRIVRIPITRENQTFTGQELVFGTGFDHPIDVIDDRAGALLVADYGSGIIYRITFQATGAGNVTHSTTVPSSSSKETVTLGYFSTEFLIAIAIVTFAVCILLYRIRTVKTGS
jgi:glucose/arabinose dehydrogenase